MTGDLLTVTESEYDHIPEGTTFSCTRDHTNEFTDRRVLSLEIQDGDVANHIGSLQVYQMPDDSSWTEIHVGLSREHDEIKFEQEV